MKRDFGLNHKSTEDVAVFHFTLEDCQWLQGKVGQDGFANELQEAIDWLEERQKAKAEGPGLSIVVIDQRRKLCDRALGMIGR